MRNSIDSCKFHAESEVTIKGWVQRIRKLGKISFIVVRDYSGLAQCVVDDNSLIENLSNESVIELTGKVVITDKTALGFEILVTKINLVNKPTKPLVFDVNQKELNANLDIMLDNRTLSMRHQNISDMLKIKSAVVQAFSEYLTNNNFFQIFTPKIVSMGAEGGSNIFNLDYFGKKAYLAQSPQFYKQMMVISGLERVFEIGPVFRAEEHNSSRHLNEYTSLDVEVGFIESFKELMKLENEILSYIFKYVNDKFNINLPEIGEIPILSIDKVKEILKSEYNFESNDVGMDSESEKKISMYIKERTGSDFLFITHYPVSDRPMYTMLNSENPEVTDSFDLLYKGIEITSGSQRIHNVEDLIASFKNKNLSLDNFKEYIQSFEIGVPPHGGFAIGLERLVMKMLNFTNARETSSFPRDCTRLTP
ncbi:Asparagine--tRNA ligase [compost metagenome]